MAPKLKDELAEIEDEIALKKYGKKFDELSDEEKDKVMKKALEEYREREMLLFDYELLY